MHTLRYAVGRGVKRLKLVAGAVKLGLDLVILLIDGVGLFVQLVQRRHPHGYLLNAQLVAQHEIALRRFRLLFQRADLHFKLFYLVVYAQEVFLSLGKLAFGLLLAVAVARDTGGLLKNLAPVGALGGDDVGDPALPDDGISVAAEAGVHEKAVYVLEAD